MFEIEYNLSLEDEINSIETTNKYVSQLPLLSWQNGYILPLMFIFIDIPSIWQCLTNNVAIHTNFAGFSILSTLSNLVFAFLTLPQIQARLPMFSWLPKFQIRQSWSREPHLIKRRKVIVSDTEFTFKEWSSYLFLEEEQEKCFSWQKLKGYFESNRGLILEFQKQEQRYFIPKRILIDEHLSQLRKILNQGGL